MRYIILSNHDPHARPGEMSFGNRREGHYILLCGVEIHSASGETTLARNVACVGKYVLGLATKGGEGGVEGGDGKSAG